MKLTSGQEQPQHGIVIISGSCCIPGMAPFDEQARRIVEQAIAETGVAAQVKIMPASTAYMGGAPREVVAHLLDSLNQTGQIDLPAVLLNGEVVSYGVPTLEKMKSSLLGAAQTAATEEARDE